MALGCEVAAVRVASVGSEYSEYGYSEYLESSERAHAPGRRGWARRCTVGRAGSSRREAGRNPQPCAAACLVRVKVGARARARVKVRAQGCASPPVLLRASASAPASHSAAITVTCPISAAKCRAVHCAKAWGWSTRVLP
eukprot:scaffold44503_cov59-Phaeocystis_antarctica.AAC.3